MFLFFAILVLNVLRLCVKKIPAKDAMISHNSQGQSDFITNHSDAEDSNFFLSKDIHFFFT